MPGCWVRTGCDGSGRGPPTGACGRGPGNGGRGGSGPPGRPGTVPGRAAIGCDGGRTPVVPVWPAAPPAAGRVVAGIPGRSTFGRGAMRGAGDVGSGGVGVVGRRSSMRSRSVGGTIRPGTTGGFETFLISGASGAAAIGDSIFGVAGSRAATVFSAGGPPTASTRDFFTPRPPPDTSTGRAGG